MPGYSWCGAGSNRRHKDFQSFALPTELPHHYLFYSNADTSPPGRPSCSSDLFHGPVGRARPDDP